MPQFLMELCAGTPGIAQGGGWATVRKQKVIGPCPLLGSFAVLKVLFNGGRKDGRMRRTS